MGGNQILINETSEKWGHVIRYILALIFFLHLFMMFNAKVKQTCSEQKIILQDGSFMGSTNFVKSLWLPDIQIFKCKQFEKRKIATDVAGNIKAIQC